MPSIEEHDSLEEASTALLAFALDPFNWVAPERVDVEALVSRPGQTTAYECRVGPLRVSACVEVSPALEVFLRVAFRGPGLTPAKAADHLEAFLKQRMPLTPNSEWQVEVDERRWIHFVRRYAAPNLEA